MMNGIKKSGLKTGYKILGYIGALFLGGISLQMLFIVWEEWNIVAGIAHTIWLYSSLILFTCVLAGSIFTLFYFSKGTVIAKESTLVKKNLGKDVVIPYSAIESITISESVIIFIGNGYKISIGSAFKDFDAFNNFIANKLKTTGKVSGKGIPFYLNEFLEDHERLPRTDKDDLVSVVIERKTGIFDIFRSYNIILDGAQIGILKRGQSKQINVLKGKHEIFLQIDWCSSNKVTFKAEDTDLKFECGSNIKGWRIMLVYLYISIWKNNYLWLKRL